MTALIIFKCPDGGYIVREAESDINLNMWRPMLYATANVDDALRYIKEKIEAKKS